MSTPLPKVILVDANFIVAAVSPTTSADDKARLAHLFEQAEKTKSRILIPMPALAEFLVRADLAGIDSFNLLEGKAFVRVAPFDRAAAFECAQLDRAAIGGSADKKDSTEAPWQKIKVDRQIVAIGKANGARLVISADKSVRNNAKRVDIASTTIEELELPESARQGRLALVERGPRKVTPTLVAVKSRAKAKPLEPGV